MKWKCLSKNVCSIGAHLVGHLQLSIDGLTLAGWKMFTYRPTLIYVLQRLVILFYVLFQQ